MSAEPAEEAVRAHLRRQYARVFTEEALARHLEERVGLGAATEMLQILRERRPDAHRILDVGAGYGSFVLVARGAGLDAVGVEPAAFELDWARARLSAVDPGSDAASAYVEGSVERLPFSDGTFDAVTLWNVLEHVPDAERALSEAARVLRRGGSLFLLAPNYAALRREAHYHVPWPPLLPKPLAALYLRALRRDPSFFVDAVFPCTKLRTLRHLTRLGLVVRDPRVEKLANLLTIERGLRRAAAAMLARLRLLALARLVLRAQLLNPLSGAILIEAVKQ